MSEARVRFPEQGDCVAIRMDPVASAAHLENGDVARGLEGRARGWYLAFVSKVVDVPDESKPYLTCVVHIVPQPPSRTGLIRDFQPRSLSAIRIRAGAGCKRDPELLAVSSQLKHALFVEAARWWCPERDQKDATPEWMNGNVEWWSEIPNRTRLVEDRWNESEDSVDSESDSVGAVVPLEEIPPDLALAGDETDVRPLVDFAYEWRESFGPPQEFLAEFDATTDAILLEQCRQTLATKCADPEECERELSVARAILQEKAFAAAIPALCSVLQADDDYSDSSTIPVAESEVSEPKGSKKRLSQGSLRHRMAQLGGGLIPKVRKRLSSLSLDNLLNSVITAIETVRTTWESSVSVALSPRRT